MNTDNIAAFIDLLSQARGDIRMLVAFYLGMEFLKTALGFGLVFSIVLFIRGLIARGIDSSGFKGECVRAFESKGYSCADYDQRVGYDARKAMIRALEEAAPRG